MTHADLVALAAKWLQRKCAIVITELNTSGEVPDAIGWQGTHSTLVECKVSRSDFMADRGKAFRREEWMGIGLKRYYLALPGIIPIKDVPERWGLLEITANGIRVAKESEHFDEANSRHEIGILLSTIRRLGQLSPQGVSIKFYTIDSKNTATLGVLQEA